MLPKIKICGITRVEDGLAAAHAGADALGLVFHPPSPRHVTPQQAATIARAMPPFVVLVGLFVDPTAESVRQTLEQCPLDRIQLHGDESPEFCAAMPRPVIKAIRVGGPEDLQNLDRFPVAALLLDAKSPGKVGGTGQRFDWNLLAEWSPPRPLILAGGLSPDNVAEAVARVRPYAVDVSSGVESAPGLKDPERIARFIRQTRDHDAPGA
ncbi:MAG: phosphoribosylanthranilate isomerase [Magnetococcales bacterium]|nr:phosphoribosylanthranilate isomerase [Magnetococcales bacterium]